MSKLSGECNSNMLKRKEREHPFYWASFIQSGEWANLDGQRKVEEMKGR